MLSKPPTAMEGFGVAFVGIMMCCAGLFIVVLGYTRTFEITSGIAQVAMGALVLGALGGGFLVFLLGVFLAVLALMRGLMGEQTDRVE